MKAYKIVNVGYNMDGNLIYTSLFAPGGFLAFYSIEKKTVPSPNLGPLTAFRTLLDARLFLDKCDEPTRRCAVIFEAEVGVSDPQPEYLANYWGDAQDLWYYWKNNIYIGPSGSLFLMTPPPGTVFCDSIQLVKRASCGGQNESL